MGRRAGRVGPATEHSGGGTHEDEAVHRPTRGAPPPRWTSRQDHHAHHAALLEQELKDETEQLTERQRRWSRQRLEDAGIALFDVEGRTNGWLYGERILAFSRVSRDELPSHRFGHGDMVTISRKRPWEENPVSGIVLDRSRTRLRVVVGDPPVGLRQGTWRIDRGANRVAHDRMMAALHAFDATEATKEATPLADLLLGSVAQPAQAAELPTALHRRDGRRWAEPTAPLPPDLNESQRKAITAALTRRLTLIQGPPGTGKTHTAVRLLATWVSEGLGPILACADSNVAVDNLLEGLLDLGVRAVRTGRPVKVRAALREATVDARLAEHPDNDELDAIRAEIDDLQRSIHSLKGRERGLAHRDVSRGWKDLRAIEQRMLDDIIDSAQIVCTTAIGAGHPLLAERRFPIVLIDEATQATEPATLVPIVRGAQRLVLVGDHHQLPPTVISHEAGDRGLSRSLFERLVELGVTTQLLTTQYRMHPIISEFPSARFYNHQLTDGVSAADRPAPAGVLWPDWDHPVAFIPLDGRERLAGDGASRDNPEEAAMVTEVVLGMLGAIELQPEDIGVVTPYNGQVRLINDLFSDLSSDPDAPLRRVEVRSVDGYQGREKEIIVLSCVRANDTGEVGFLRDWRRLNVALTRARRGLVVVGHAQTLRHDETWAAWLDWVADRKLEAWHLIT